MRSILLIAALLVPSASSAHHVKRHFDCHELRGLPHLSRAYNDTLEACIWDYRHPNKRDVVK